MRTHKTSKIRVTKRNEKTKQYRISDKTKPKDLSKLIQSYLAFCAWANSFLANSKSFKTAASGLLPSGASDLLIFLFFTSLGWFNLKQKRSYQFQLMDSGNLWIALKSYNSSFVCSHQYKRKWKWEKKEGWKCPVPEKVIPSNNHTISLQTKEWGRVKITGEYRPN